MRRLAILLLCVVVLDFGLSALLSNLFHRTDSGERGGLSNFALQQSADVLVLGSSRAQLQIDPAIIGAGLSLRAFNAGLKGHDFLYAAAFFDLWRDRHPPPRAVILTADVESFLHRPTEAAAAQVLAPYIGESGLLRRIIYTEGPQKRLEYLLRSYRYNGKVLSIAKNLFLHTDGSYNGFIPLDGVLRSTDRTLIRNALDQQETALTYARAPFWDIKTGILRELGARAMREGTLVLLVHTPLYGQDLEAHAIWIARMKELVASTPGIQFVDLCEQALPGYFPNPRELFWDVNHLNRKGAQILSGLVVRELRQRLDAGRSLPLATQR